MKFFSCVVLTAFFLASGLVTSMAINKETANYVKTHGTDLAGKEIVVNVASLYPENRGGNGIHLVNAATWDIGEHIEAGIITVAITDEQIDSALKHFGTTYKEDTMRLKGIVIVYHNTVYIDFNGKLTNAGDLDKLYSLLDPSWSRGSTPVAPPPPSGPMN